ncbi:MAG TPA: 30S ribosomal protein S4e [archaeon]|nr:30S ribosomal protein S4e [archaeon]
MGHLKRSQAPKFWPIKRKGLVWTVKTSPGPHRLQDSMPLQILVRDVLKVADTAKEATSIIKQGKIVIDKKPRKDPKFPVGLMDIIEIPEVKKNFVVSMGTSGLTLIEADQSKTANKLCKIVGKTTIKNGLHQLHLHDGRNILAESDQYRVGDSIAIALPDQTITDHLQFEEGSDVTIINGKNRGLSGSVKKIVPRKTAVEKSKVIVDLGKKELETPKNYLMVTGKKGSSDKTEPLISEPKKKKGK